MLKLLRKSTIDAIDDLKLGVHWTAPLQRQRKSELSLIMTCKWDAFFHKKPNNVQKRHEIGPQIIFIQDYQDYC